MKPLSAMCPVVAGNDLGNDRDKDVGFIVFDTIRHAFRREHASGYECKQWGCNARREITEIEDTKRNTVDTDMDDKDVGLRRLYCHSLPFSSCYGVPAITNVDD